MRKLISLYFYSFILFAANKSKQNHLLFIMYFGYFCTSKSKDKSVKNMTQKFLNKKQGTHAPCFLILKL